MAGAGHVFQPCGILGDRFALKGFLVAVKYLELEEIHGSDCFWFLLVLSQHFPGFNIVRLLQLSCGYLKEILQGLARGSGRRHLLCFFQVQTFDDPDIWQPRGSEVAARWRRGDLARNPLREHRDLIHVIILFFFSGSGVDILRVDFGSSRQRL